MAKEKCIYTIEMEKIGESVLQKLFVIRERRGEYAPTGIGSINSIIGGKMEGYLNIRNKTYNSAEELLDAYCAAISPNDVLLDFLKDDECRRYFELFIRRYFERYKTTIKKNKPAKELYDLWFGDNNNLFELLITPTYRMNFNEKKEMWENDESEIRKVGFNYWTVQHLLSTGVIDVKHNTHISFADIDILIEFYKRNFCDNSKSIYEQEIMKRYFVLLKESDDYDNIAFLIPELRLLKGEMKHKSRLDFSVLTEKEKVGFEISPDSTHAYTRDIRNKDEDTIKKEEKERWNKEMEKINDFQEKYGIHIKTFLQEELLDIDKCFERIKDYLIIKNQYKEKGAWKRFCESYSS